jgi:hypothetical protein
LELYFDESGHSADKPLIVMAGYMAPAEHWVGFAEEWNAALVKAGVVLPDGSPGLFHMTDCETKHGAFEGWSETQRRSLLGDLMGTIERHRLHATGFVISTAWWKTIDWKDEHPDHLGLEDPYHHAMQNAIATALVMTADQVAAPELFSPERVKCVFSQQGEFQGRATAYMAALSHFLSRDRPGFATVEYGDPAKLPQLQAADIVAFEFRWRLTCPTVDRWPMRQILNSGRSMFAGMPQGILNNASLGGEVRPIEFPTQVLQVGEKLARELTAPTSTPDRNAPS